MTQQQMISALITLTAGASYLNYRFIRLPKSIGLVVVTIALSVLVLLLGALGFDLYAQLKDLLRHINFSETFMRGMLSFLLFAGALHINVVELAKYKWTVALLASVGILISTALIGTAVWLLTLVLPFEIPFIYCVIFGALISPTDPIIVLNVFKNMSIPKNIEMKIAGESLFNDGMVVVIFIILVKMTTGGQSDVGASAVTLAFLRQALGGIALGATLGGGVAAMILKVKNYEVAMLLTLALVTGGYVLAHDFFDVSGVITMVVAGLFIGHACRKGEMRKKEMEQLGGFWELIDEVLNAMLFVMIGLEVIALNVNATVIILALCAIPITLIARYLSVLLPVVCLNKFKAFNHALLLLMTWGGMRGGISIALALSLPESQSRDLIIAVTYAVVLFSIIVQGLTFEKVIQKLVPSAR